MRYNIKPHGAVKSGHADVTIRQVGAVYDVSYRAKVKVKKFLFSKTFEHTGSIRVPRSQLSESFLKCSESNTFNIKGMTFKKANPDSRRFVYGNGVVSGEILLSYDNLDPVEIECVVVHFMGFKAVFAKV